MVMLWADETLVCQQLQLREGLLEVGILIQMSEYGKFYSRNILLFVARKYQILASTSFRYICILFGIFAFGKLRWTNRKTILSLQCQQCQRNFSNANFNLMQFISASRIHLPKANNLHCHYFSRHVFTVLEYI